MASTSYFHDYYKEHSAELLEELQDPMMSIPRFQKKYRIGSGIYNRYFGGVKIWRHSTHGKALTSDVERVDGVKIGEKDIYRDRKKAIAEKFGISPGHVQAKVNKGYTLTEIETGKFNKGEFIPGHLSKKLLKYV